MNPEPHSNGTDPIIEEIQTAVDAAFAGEQGKAFKLAVEEIWRLP
jgi:hypothetical protein